MVKSNKNKGFTLAELLIVVAVIAVLVAIAIPTFNNQLEKSRQAVDVSNLRGAFAAARLAQIDQGVGTERFKDAVTKDGGLQYWYNPDTGSLTRVTTVKDDTDDDSTNETAKSAVEKGYAAYGKATGANLMADTSQLPGGGVIKYGNNTLKQSENSHTGMVDKAILVKFMEDGRNKGNYIIYKITFVEEAGKTGEPTITALELKLKGDTGKDAAHAIQLKGDGMLPYDLFAEASPVLEISGMDDTGESLSSFSSVTYAEDGTSVLSSSNLKLTSHGTIDQLGETAPTALPSATVKIKATWTPPVGVEATDVASEPVSVSVKYTD